ncbi:MAG TPA: carbohydrate porin [Tepidisphaeraceae bacterium]
MRTNASVATLWATVVLFALRGPGAGAQQESSPNLTGDWAARKALAERGVTFDIDLTADGTKNLRGGLDTAGSTWRWMLEGTLTLDTKPLLGLEGGTIFVDFQEAQGPNPSDELIGDVQGIDGLDGVPGTSHQNRTQLAQLWYQQTAFGGALRVKAGKVDANSEFDRSTTAQEFLHQSTGSSATLFTMPTYPDAATSINIFVKPNDRLQIGFGLYDGSFAEGIRTGDLGPATFFHDAQDLFLIAEIDQSWELGRDRLAGRLAVGGWYSTNRFARLDGGQVTGTGGPYLVLDQALWRANPKDKDDGRGIDLFLMYGYADPAIVIFDHNLGGGVSWTGPIPGRPDDVVGMGFQSVHFSDGYQPTGRFETSYEAFYRIQVRPWFAVKPDLQYIANPGGKGTPDALALTVRLEVHF